MLALKEAEGRPEQRGSCLVPMHTVHAVCLAC